MKKKITKIGNKKVLVLSQALLKQLGIDETTPLTIEVEHNRLVITPETSKNITNAQFKKSFKKVLKDFGPVFDDLAKQ